MEWIGGSALSEWSGVRLEDEDKQVTKLVLASSHPYP